MVEVDQVVPSPKGFGLFRAYALESPHAPSTSPSYSFDLEGWAIGRSSPLAAVELVQDETCLWRVPATAERPDVAARFGLPAGEHTVGFYRPVNCLRLPTEFDCAVAAVAQDGSRVHIGDIRGSRAPLSPGFEPSLRPLMVTTLGRTGSSLFLRMLQGHPEIAAYRPLEYEPRTLEYWMEVFLSLSDPASYLNQLDPPIDLDAEKMWWLGEQRSAPRRTAYRISEPELSEWMGQANLGQLAGMFQSRVEAMYERVGGLQDKQPVYFAEKLIPNNTPTLVWELYPEVREVFLVRDFRDMVSSMLAFNLKRGGRELLGRDLATTNVDYVLEQVRNGVFRLCKSWERRRHVAHVVRYEDLVRQPEETLEGLLAYLGLESGRDSTNAILRRIAPDTRHSQAHRTTRGAEESIGRWQHDLGPELQAACEQALGFALEEFGYSHEVAASA
jgi:hypothetical protein